MIVGAERGDIEGLVVWESVVCGQAYLEELATWHREMLWYSPTKGRTTGEKCTEILGFPLTDSLVAELVMIDLLAIQQKPAQHILVIESSEENHAERVREHLKKMGGHVDHQRLASSKVWREDVNQALVPHRTLQCIISWVSRVCP